MKKSNKKGYSLLELLLVLAIVSALIVAAFIIYPKVQAAQRANTEITNISIIDAGIKSLYSVRPDMSGISTDTLIKAKIFPDNMLNNGLVVNSFRGNVVVQPSDYEKGTYELIYYNVPRIECAKIAVGVFNKFAQVQVENSVVKNDSQTMTVTEVLPKIVSLCDEKNNTLVFNSF